MLPLDTYKRDISSLLLVVVDPNLCARSVWTDWLKGTSTAKPHIFFWENLWFPVHFLCLKPINWDLGNHSQQKRSSGVFWLQSTEISEVEHPGIVWSRGIRAGQTCLRNPQSVCFLKTTQECSMQRCKFVCFSNEDGNNQSVSCQGHFRFYVSVFHL